MLLYFKRLLGHKRVRLQRQGKRKQVFAYILESINEFDLKSRRFPD